MEILLEKYPHIIISANKYIKNYLLSEENTSVNSMTVLSNDDREITFQSGLATGIETRLEKLRQAFIKVVDMNLPIFGHESETKVELAEFLDTVITLMKTNVRVIKSE